MNNTPKTARSAMSKFAKPDHKAMARQLGYALTISDESGWSVFTVAARRRLGVRERVSLAWAAMMALDDHEAEAVAETVLGGSGGPMAPFGDPLDDARFWASVASESERRAYALASFEKMAVHDRGDFADFVQEFA